MALKYCRMPKCIKRPDTEPPLRVAAARSQCPSCDDAGKKHFSVNALQGTEYSTHIIWVCLCCVQPIAHGHLCPFMHLSMSSHSGYRLCIAC